MFEYRSVALVSCRLAQSLILSFSLSANNIRTAGPIEIGEALIDTYLCFDLGKIVVPIQNHGARATCKGTFVV